MSVLCSKLVQLVKRHIYHYYFKWEQSNVAIALTFMSVLSCSDWVQAFILKRRRPSPRCSVAVLCGGVDAAEAGECEALTGRWWREAVGARSPVKCVCSSEHNTGLPSQRGKHVPAQDYCCMSLLPRLFIFFWKCIIIPCLPIWATLAP